MTRTRPAVVRTFLLAILVCSLHGVATAAEPPASAAKTDSGPGKHLPLVIGGGVTLAILGLGFILLGSKPKPQEPRVPTEKDPAYDDLPRDVVPAANPLRYF